MGRRFESCREAAYELEQRQKKEIAELIEAIEYYERTGQSPPGYDIIE